MCYIVHYILDIYSFIYWIYWIYWNGDQQKVGKFMYFACILYAFLALQQPSTASFTFDGW